MVCYQLRLGVQGAVLTSRSSARAQSLGAMRTLAVTFVALLGACNAVSGHELATAFSDSVKVLSTASSSSVEYCPDNTCEVFSLAGSSSLEILQDFAVAWLYGVSDYLVLKPLQVEPPSSPVAAVLARYRQHCPMVPGSESARCVVRVLASRYAIQVAFARYDEGRRTVVPVSLARFQHGT
jgi:hypothetical protein